MNRYGPGQDIICTRSELGMDSGLGGQLYLKADIILVKKFT